MDLSFMQNEVVLALCWTLIHSLWQGLLLATVTGAVMIGTRKSSAGKRYKILTGLFFVFMAATVVTFIIEYNSISHISQLATLPATVAGAETVFPVAGFSPSNIVTIETPLLQRFKDYFNTHASMIVMIWLVIFIARLIRLAANLVYVNRLKHYKTFAPPAHWHDRLNELVVVMGLKKKIQLLESGVVKVPVVMGILKPVVLLPLGLLAHLPSDEIEAILLHELAHIKRRDYLVNLLQNFAETIFFFNPALMWVSSMIREERENCCDDIAISVTNSKSNFINALIAFQEYNFSGSRYTVGFPGRKNQLLNRVKRIINEKNKTLNAAEKSILTFGMGVLILFSFAAAKKITPPAVKEVLSNASPYRQPAEKNIVPASVQQSPATRKNQAITAGAVDEYMTVTADPGNIVPVAAQMMYDTVPVKKPQVTNSNRSVYGEEKSNAIHAKTYSIAGDSISNLFTGISTNIRNNDVTITATHKNGTEYRFRKLDGIVQEFYINNQAFTNIDNYRSVILDIERAVEYRKLRTQERHALDLQRRQQGMLDKQKQMEQHAMDFKKSHQEQFEKRQLEIKAKHDAMQHQKAKEDSAHQSKKTLSLKVKPEHLNHFEKKTTFQTQSKFDLATKTTAGPGTTYKAELVYELNSKEIFKRDAKRKMDSARAVSVEKMRESFAGKERNMRARQAEDKLRYERSASTIREIIGDLEKEGVKIVLEKSWFGLDKDQFVVDGKKMPKDVHEKFIKKYVTSKDGMGYYYGSGQVTGRGIIFDYKDLVR